MVAILSATAFSLLLSAQAGPRYEAELLTLQSKSSLKEAGRINTSGDYCGIDNPSRHFAVIGGNQFYLPGPGANAWCSEALFDIDEKGALYGWYRPSSAPIGSGVYVAQKGSYTLMPIASDLRIADPFKYPGFVTADGRIIFHVSPRLTGNSQNCSAVQLRGKQLTYFPTSVAGAQGSIVTCVTEKGQAGGILLYGTLSQTGNLAVTRQCPAIWTENDDVVMLEIKKEWRHSMVCAMVDKDLAYGEATLGNGQGISVVWIEGKPSAMTGAYNENLFVSHIAKGNPVGLVLNGKRKFAGILIDGKVKPLADFVTNLTKNTVLEDSLDVASDGSILVSGKKDGYLATFRLKPVAK